MGIMNGLMVLILIASADSAPPPLSAPVQPAQKVTVAHPRNSEIRQAIQLPAILYPFQRVSIVAKVPGYIGKLIVDKGDRVKKDELLAEISVPEMGPELELAKAKARAAEARLGKAKAGVEIGTSTHHRLATLHATDPGAITEQDVEVAASQEETARAEARGAQDDIAVAKAEIRRLEALMQYLRIVAPFDGTVTQRFLDNGAFAAAPAGVGTAIVELSQVSTLRLAFDLPEPLVPFVTQGYRLRYALAALPGKMFDGVVARRTDSLSDDAHTMRFEVDVRNNEGQFAPGMYGSVRIPLEQTPGIVELPASALRIVDAKTCVFTVEAGKLKEVRVESLVSDRASVIVSGDLTPDAQVVTGGSASLTEGQQVEAEEGQK